MKMAENLNKQFKTDKIFGNMTTDEFQSKLYVWFEERGVLSELRTHLRHQMIEALKTTEIGRQVNSEQKLNLNLSPKYQALNLIIAEYLLQQGYHYALSVFSSEVPMLSSLPTFTRPINTSENDFKNGKLHIKFKERDVWDILEALGLPMGSDEAQIIFSAYQSNILNDTLLVCLIRMLPTALKNKEMKIKASTSSIDIQNNNPSNTNINIDKQSTTRETIKNIPSCSGTSIEETNESDKKRKSNFKERKRKLPELSISSCDDSKSLPDRISRWETKSRASTQSIITPVEFESALVDLHERMQKAFDRELEIARQEEWDKCRNIIENREKEIESELQLEKTKFKKMEQRTKEKIQREIELEKIRLAEQQKVKLLEMERTIERELQLERCKLLNEYRNNAANKGTDVSEFLIQQQNNLDTALRKVEQQSNRLKEKEDLLNKKLNDLENNFYKKAKSSHASQSHRNEENFMVERKVVENLKLELDMLRKKIESEPSVLSMAKSPTIDKAVQTRSSKNIQTYENGSTESSDKSVKYEDDFEKLLKSKKKLKGDKNKTFSSEKSDIKNQSMEEKNGFSNQKNSFQQMNDPENPLSYVLKTLHHENTYLKAFTTQQRQQIQELLSKQMCMGKEVSEANAQVQELSTQLVELGKVMKTGQLDHSRIKSAPSTLHRKNTTSELKGDKQQWKRNQNTDKNPDYKPKHSPSISSDESIAGERTLRRRSLPNSKKTLRKPRKGSCGRVKENESSPTDDVLKDAKKRLRMLELESDAVDRSYQEFKQRQSVYVESDKNSSIKDIYNRKLSETDVVPKSVYFTKKSTSTIDTSRDLSNSRIYADTRTPLTPEASKRIPYENLRESSPSYNVLRRVHSSTMNIDKNVLQNYISSVDKMKRFSSRNPNTFTKLLVHNKLQRNVKSMSDISAGSNFAGTTAFLLERIENCTSNRKKFSPRVLEAKRLNTYIKSNVLNEDKEVVKSGANIVSGVSKTFESYRNKSGNFDDESERFVKSFSDIKLKPSVNFRNLQLNSKDKVSVSEVHLIQQENRELGHLRNTVSSCGIRESQNIKSATQLHAGSFNIEIFDTQKVESAKTKDDVLNNKVVSANDNIVMASKNLDRESVRRKLFADDNISSELPASVVASVSDSLKDNNILVNEKPASFPIVIAGVEKTPPYDEVRELSNNLTNILNLVELSEHKLDQESNEPKTNPSSSNENGTNKIQQSDVTVLKTNEKVDDEILERDSVDVNEKVIDFLNENIVEVNKELIGVQDPVEVMDKHKVDDINAVEKYSLISLEKNEESVSNAEKFVSNIVQTNLNEDVASVEINKTKLKDLEAIEEVNLSEVSNTIKPNERDEFPSVVVDTKSLVKDLEFSERDEKEIEVDGSFKYLSKEQDSGDKTNEDNVPTVDDLIQIDEEFTKDEVNETVDSEEIVVPSSIELSSDHSPISIPQASDDNESFWN